MLQYELLIRNEMSKVYYIHGYGSSLNSETLKKLRNFFPGTIGLTYDPLKPNESVQKLCSQVLEEYDSNDFPTIIGSSLGGWYADQLTSSVAADFILYNPCISPEISLVKHHLSMDVLNEYKSDKSSVVPRTIVLSMDDEVIDPIFTLAKYQSSNKIIKTSGGHRMTDENLTLIAQRAIYLQNQLTM